MYIYNASIMWRTAVILLIMVLISICYSQATEHRKHPFVPNTMYTVTWGWATEPWSNDDALYQEARAKIDKVSGSSKQIADLLAQDKDQAKADVSNPLAVYRWAYAAYVITRDQDFDVARLTMEEPQEAFQEAPSPHTYEYIRLRFLYAMLFESDPKQLAPLAESLYAANRNDYSVASIYLNDYRYPPFEKIIALCEQLKRLGPSRPNIYTTIGFLHVDRWYQYHDTADARAVVANYKKYLQLAPPQEPWRKRAQQIINQFQTKTYNLLQK